MGKSGRVNAICGKSRNTIAIRMMSIVFKHGFVCAYSLAWHSSGVLMQGFGAMYD